MTDDDDAPIRVFARQVVETEAAAVGLMAAATATPAFAAAVRLLLTCGGAVVVSGIGKAGHVARKLSATLASTGTPSHFLNPADAAHGDLGSVRSGDVVVLLSSSGESDEIVRLLPVVRALGNRVVAITANATSTLGRYADVAVAMGRVQEACPLGLAPSASTTAMLALGDALALTVMHLRRFTADDFARFHPAGQLGRKLIRVREAMTFRLGENLSVAADHLTVARVLHDVGAIKRRSGAVVLTDESTGKVSGIFTDGDLRRLVTDADPNRRLAMPVADVMHRNPKRVGADALATDAMAVMRRHRIDDLPVVDADDRPVGLIDVQDLVVLKLFDVDPAEA